jgi:predicted XRE-type DNA-binding protein
MHLTAPKWHQLRFLRSPRATSSTPPATPLGEMLEMKVKAEIWQALLQHIEQHGFARTYLVTTLKAHQPDVSNRLRGKTSRTSLPKLIQFAGWLNLDARVKVASPKATGKRLSFPEAIHGKSWQGQTRVDSRVGTRQPGRNWLAEAALGRRKNLSSPGAFTSFRKLPGCATQRVVVDLRCGPSSMPCPTIADRPAWRSESLFGRDWWADLSRRTQL